MIEKFERQENISEIRKQKLTEVIEQMKRELSGKEIASIKAVLLFGSTARGTATEKSDIDIWIVPEENMPFNSEAVKKVMKIIEGKMPDEEIQYGLRSVVSPEGRTAKFLTKESLKHPGEVSIWKFLYSKNPEAEKEINDILKETQEKSKEK